MLRKILLILLIPLVIIQFIHPKRNKAEGPQPNYIGNAYQIPDDVKGILKKACNDCHSNNTRYPWYTYTQPADWWITHHVNEGKRSLNFDEFSNRPARYQYKKMDEVIDLVKEGEMPLKSYLWIHKDAKLTQQEKATLTTWAQSVRTTLEGKYPVDSLQRAKPR